MNYLTLYATVASVGVSKLYSALTTSSEIRIYKFNTQHRNNVMDLF